jgi:MerR family copper efflux transcriptional regulator
MKLENKIEKMMNIGQAADLSKLPVKTIRYYEDIKLVTPNRLSNGYRDYSENDVHKLAFLQRSRSLGFSIEECRLLLSLYDDDQRSSSDVRSIASAKIGEIDKKIKELQSLELTLEALVQNCHGDGKPDCPIIDSLAGKLDQQSS